MNISNSFSNVGITASNLVTDSVVQDDAIRPVVPPASPSQEADSDSQFLNDRNNSQGNANVVASENPTYDLPQNAESDQTNANQEQEEPEATDEQGSSDTEENATGQQFTEVELQEIEELKARDAEVVAHEQAHANVGGQYAGSPSYSYETGPDGVKYAVSGEVPIDISKIEGDPQATLTKAQQVRSAALAPAEPSAQDRKVAAQAVQLASEARKEILLEDVESAEENNELENDNPNDSLNSDNNLEAESFNELTLLEDSELQQTLANRSAHINTFYQQSSQASAESLFSQQA